jgi:nucleotide-binding universal stress UspA family protein
VADREEAGLIVMGTRGMTNRSPIADLVLGNVAQEVLRHAHCPVLVVP